MQRPLPWAGPRFLSIERLCKRPEVLHACDVLGLPSLGEVLAGIGRPSASMILNQNDLIIKKYFFNILT
jgi:hypothetical protein